MKYIALTPPAIATERPWWFGVAKSLWGGTDKHPSERSFLIKLDWFLLSSSCAGYFLKTLNSSDVGTAYVNGMKEHYDILSNQYNNMDTMRTVGYIIGQIPSNLILHRISARYYLAGLEVLWSILRVLLVTPKSLGEMYTSRFIIGLTESVYFPGLEYLMGSWYSREELSKRSTIFACTATAAGLISSPVQHAILESKWSHAHNLKPFQMMFVIDAAISVPIALYTTSLHKHPLHYHCLLFQRNRCPCYSWKKKKNWCSIKHREKYTWYIWVLPALFLTFNNSYQPVSSQAF